MCRLSRQRFKDEKINIFRWFIGEKRGGKYEKSFGDERTFTLKINRLLILNDISFYFVNFSLHFSLDFHSRTLRISARRWARSTTTLPNDFRILRKIRKAGRIRFDTIWVSTSVSSKFHAKVAGNEREIIGLWVIKHWIFLNAWLNLQLI